MSTLTDILTQFPNCRITISTSSSRRKPQQGDRRWTKRYGWQIRRRQFSIYYGSYCSRNGRPVYEWVREADLPTDELKSLRRVAEWHGGTRDVTTRANRARLAAAAQSTS